MSKLLQAVANLLTSFLLVRRRTDMLWKVTLIMRANNGARKGHTNGKTFCLLV